MRESRDNYFGKLIDRYIGLRWWYTVAVATLLVAAALTVAARDQYAVPAAARSEVASP